MEAATAGGLRAPAEQRAYVATLKQRFAFRRNFMKLLGTRTQRAARASVAPAPSQ
jgi:hypothetical protein